MHERWSGWDRYLSACNRSCPHAIGPTEGEAVPCRCGYCEKRRQLYRTAHSAGSPCVHWLPGTCPPPPDRRWNWRRRPSAVLPWVRHPLEETSIVRSPAGPASGWQPFFPTCPSTRMHLADAQTTVDDWFPRMSSWGQARECCTRDRRESLLLRRCSKCRIHPQLRLLGPPSSCRLPIFPDKAFY